MQVSIIIIGLIRITNLIDNSRIHIINSTWLGIKTLRLSILKTSSYSHESTGHMHIRRSHYWSIIYSFFKLCVGLFLNSLSVLQFFNKFHLKHFHLHYFSLLLSDQLFFFCYFFCNFFPCSIKFLFTEFFNFCPLNSFLLLLYSVFHFFFLFLLHEYLIMTIFLLFSDELGLFSFFFFVQYNCIVHF